MTPAEREALKLAAEKATPGPWKKNNGQGYEHWVMSDHVLSGAVAFPNTVNENVMNDAEYIAAASPDVILHLLSLISSLELTLSNSTNLNVLQMEKIDALEVVLSNYVICGGCDWCLEQAKSILAAPTEPTPEESDHKESE